MASYLGAIWRCRYFWLALVRMDLRTRYRRSVLGLGWSLLHPLMMTTILCLVFHGLFQVDVREYAPYLLTGLACWQFLVTATLQGADCFFQAENYIRQSSVPLAVYPLRTALGAMVHFLIALTLAAALTVVFQGFMSAGDASPTAMATLSDQAAAYPVAVIMLVPAVTLFFLLAWSLALLAGLVTSVFQDVRHVLEVAFQGLFYLTPIIYMPAMLQARGLGWLLNLNPLVAFLELIREPLQCRWPDPVHLGTAALTVMVVGSLAGLLLTRMQRRLIFYL